MPANLTESVPHVVSIQHTASGASAEVYLYGATVTSWKARDQERLFVSTKAILDESKAIRGGIPVVFPIFGTKEGISLPQHGFARITKWEWLGIITETDDEISVRFGLKDTQLTHALRSAWPHSFRITYTITLTADTLKTILAVKNEGSDAFEFNTLLHTYLAVPDVSRARISGLTGHTFVDKVVAGARALEERELVAIEGEVDRVYLDVKTPEIRVDDGTGGGYIVRKTGVKDTVVWNIGAEKARAMADMGDDDWPRYVCVEVGSVAEWVLLGGGESWTGGQSITAL